MKKDLEKLLEEKVKNEEAYIYIDENNIRICGETPELLTQYSIITNKMYELEGVDEDMVELAFKLGRMTPKEQCEILKEKLTKIMEILEEE